MSSFFRHSQIPIPSGLFLTTKKIKFCGNPSLAMEMENKMLYDRRPCQPLCRPPDKRDFMDYNPAKSAEEFYANYDPMVGIGTAAILLLFMVLLTAKSLIRWSIKHWRHRKYVRRRDKKAKKLVTIVAEGTEMATPQQRHNPPMRSTIGSHNKTQPNGDVV